MLGDRRCEKVFKDRVLRGICICHCCWWFRNPANQLICKISHYLKGFIHLQLTWLTGKSLFSNMRCTSSYMFSIVMLVSGGVYHVTLLWHTTMAVSQDVLKNSSGFFSKLMYLLLDICEAHWFEFEVPISVGSTTQLPGTSFSNQFFQTRIKNMFCWNHQRWNVCFRECISNISNFLCGGEVKAYQTGFWRSDSENFVWG